MITVKRIISAVHYKYEGQRDKPVSTDVFFNDGTKLGFDGHWIFKVGESYEIQYSDGNPFTVETIVLKM